jgi:glycosyltransferase involved in cell wall biosynthesis
VRLAIHGFRVLGNLTGVPRYLLNLLRQWDEEPGPFNSIALLTHRPWNGERAPAYANVQKVPLRPRLPYALAEQFLLPRFARADVLFCPAYTMPVGYRGRCVVTIHDMMQELIPDSFPWWCRLRYGPLYRYSARRADLVLTDSEHSKDDIVRIYGLAEHKVRAIPLASDVCFRPLDDQARITSARRELGIVDRPSVLFVGKLSKRRNIPMLLEAFSRAVRAAVVPHALVLVGVNHLELPLDKLVSEFDLTGRLVHRNDVDDERLIALYNGADCMVYPSSYEGFGLPPLEAMSCGCPVILFRNSSLIEVGGDAAHFAGSPTTDGLTDALVTVLRSPAYRDDLRARGLEQSKRFCWKRTARETLAALEEVARG